MSRLSCWALIAAFALASIAPSCSTSEVKTGADNAKESGEETPVNGPHAAKQETPKPETKPQRGSQPAKAKENIDVSATTTFLEGPLTGDARVDYVAAFNGRWREGVTPENNAAVPILQAIGLSPLRKEVRDRYVTLLGIKAPPAEGDYLVSLGDFVERQQPELSHDEQMEYYDRLEEAQTRPWSPDEYPVLAAWFEENRIPLDLIVRGVHRPRYYSPLVGEHLAGAMVYDVNNMVREIARSLPARAMLRLQADGAEAAWGDLMACLRLARHHTKASTMVQMLIGIAVQGIACDSARALASYANLTPDQIHQIHNDLEELGSVSLTDGHLVFERCSMLENMARWPYQGPGEVELEMLEGLDGLFDPQRPINWNETLREMNRHFDRLPAIIAKSCVEEQISAFKQFESEIRTELWGEREPIEVLWNLEPIVKHVMQGETPKERARRLAAMFADLSASVYDNVLSACGRASDDLQLTRITFALAGYRRDHKTYPTELSDLCPRYTDALGKSRVADSDFHYRRIGIGFTISNFVPGSTSSSDSMNRTAVAFDYKNYRQATARLRQSGWHIRDTDASSDKATVRDEDLLLVASLPTLEFLSIYGASNVKDTGLAHLSDMPRLRYLSVYEADSITDDGIARLVSSGTVDHLSLPDCRVTDIGLQHISGLTNLGSLDLSGTHISDKGLAHVSGLTRLTLLEISRTRISDRGLVYLKPLLKLESLDLSQTNITDAGLAELPHLKKLKTLELEGAKITDAGVAQLAKIQSLESVTLSHTGISDRAFVHLRDLAKLDSLTLDGTGVTDDGLKSIAQIGTLTWLDLSSTKITEAGLPRLYTLTNLKYISLFDVPLSESALEQLEQALPDCEISR